jgi:hypothetical protein
MKLALLAGVVLFPWGGWGQTDPGNSSWNPLLEATDVVVAEVLSNSFSDAGAEIHVSSRLRATRVLAGGMVPGEEFHLEWAYRPSPADSVATAGRQLSSTALFLLNRRADDFELLPAAQGPGIWSAVLPMPTAPPAGGFAYAGNDIREAKLACEIGSAVQELVRDHAADLVVPSVPPMSQLSRPIPPPPPFATTFPPSDAVLTRGRFAGLIAALATLDRRVTLPVYRYFTALPDASVKLSGLVGRMADGDLNAIFELESDLPRLASSFAARGRDVMRQTMRIDLHGNLPAAHALGRIALGETPLQGMETSLGMRLATTHSLEVLPYFMTLLQAPSAGTRDDALRNLCQLLRPAPGSNTKKFWKDKMADYCPSQVPLKDGAAERKDIEFWTNWWSANRDAIARVANLPSVSAPARWAAAVPSAQPAPDGVLIMVMHFGSLIARESMRSSGLVRPTVPLVGSLGKSDTNVYREVLSAAWARVEESRQRGNAAMSAARAAGTVSVTGQIPRPVDIYKSGLDARPADIYKSGLDALHDRLSAKGWGTVEKYLKGM